MSFTNLMSSNVICISSYHIYVIKAAKRQIIRKSTSSKSHSSSLLPLLYLMLRRKDVIYKPALSLLRLVFDGNKQQLQLHVTQPVKHVHSLEESSMEAND